MKRQAPNISQKCASALLQLKTDKGEYLIPWEHAQMMTVTQILSLFQWDHYPIRVEAGGSNHPSNLVPRLIAEHRAKTSNTDIPEVAKIKRITAAEKEFQSRLFAKTSGEPKPKSRWPSRSMGRRK